MNLSLAYLLLNFAVMPAWALLVVAPEWRWTDRVVQAAFIPLILAAIYTYLLGWSMFFGGAAEGAGMMSLPQVMALFDSPVSTLGGWTHYLAFDLFVGMWIVRDGRRHNIGSAWRAPCLLLTLMFGPIGLAVYLALRWARLDKVSLLEQ